MADSYVQVNADGTGKKVDSEQVTVGANDVQRQRVEIAGAAAAAVAAVQATTVAGTEQGLVVRPIELAVATNEGGGKAISPSLKVIGYWDTTEEAFWPLEGKAGVIKVMLYAMDNGSPTPVTCNSAGAIATYIWAD